MKFVHDETHNGVKVVGFRHANHSKKTGLLLLFSAQPPLLHDPPPPIIVANCNGAMGNVDDDGCVTT